MRNGWPGALGATCWALVGALVAASSSVAARGDPPANGPTVRLTIEVAATPGPVDLSLTEGRILSAGPAAEPRPDGTWRTGARVRARVEAPLGATLTVEAGSQAVRVPLLRLLDGPQRATPVGSDPGGLAVEVARVDWDTIEVDPGDFDGVATPGAKVPLLVGFNVLSTDAAEVNLRYTAELTSARTGVVVWQGGEGRAVIPTDTAAPASAWALSVPAPAVEGTYALTLRATWEPTAGGDGSRLGRFLRRRRAANAPIGPHSATRTVTFAVVDPGKAKPTPPTPTRGGALAAEDVVDAIDLARPRGYRPSASGRAPGGPSWQVPEAAVVEETRRDRLRGWIARGGESVSLGAGDGTGLAWAAVGLKAPRPDRPHRLTLTVNGGHPSALGVGLIATGVGPGRAPRVVLDACASGPPLIEGNRPQVYSWVVWPEVTGPVLVLVNRNGSSPVHLGTVSLAELPEVPAGPAVVPPGDASPRVVGVDLTTPGALDRFGGGDDPVASARNLARYLIYCGATSAVLPDALADRARRRALDGQGEQDGVGPDRLDLALTLLGRLGLSTWVDLGPDAPLPGLPPAGSDEARVRGLVRLDRVGQPDLAAPSYQPIHPEVRSALARRVAGLAGLRRSHPGLSGLLIRLGPGSTLLGRPDSGLDDPTFARFVAEMFEPWLARSIPGLGLTDPGRFEARARFVEGPGQKPWLAWRAREVAALYAELGSVAAKAAPGARLAVATPDLEAGAVNEEIRRLDRLGLGLAGAWRSAGLDLTAWPAGEAAPIVLRGTGLSADDLATDLASSPELDDQVAARPARGLWLGTSSIPSIAEGLALSAPPLPDAFGGDEPLGHALAALDGGLFFASIDAVVGREDRLRRFAGVVRSLPAPPPGPAAPRLASGVSARVVRAGGASYLALANDTPYPIRLESTLRCPAGAALVDLSRTAPLVAEPVPGGLRVVADLPPFGVASARVDAADVSLGSAEPHPGAAVLDGMKAQYDDLAVIYARLNRVAAGESGSGPPNADFEADVRLTSARVAQAPIGWGASGDPRASVCLDPDRPHAGRGSLRLDAPGGPAGAVSEPFVPSGHPSVTIHAWLRADRPETRVRLWLEGRAAGRPYSWELEVAARPDWSATAVRASGIPAPGLESARLRFELLSPGRLWVDDLSISGPALTEPERLNARRDLLAALSAYREHRYGDFARLAGSHWTRHVASEPAATGRLAGDRSGLIRTGDASTPPLPPPRRLR